MNNPAQEALGRMMRKSNLSPDLPGRLVNSSDGSRLALTTGFFELGINSDLTNGICWIAKRFHWSVVG